MTVRVVSITIAKPKTHILKTWAKEFEAVWNGNKRFEIRNNDRDFQVCDFVLLVDTDMSTLENNGRSVLAEITYMVKGPDFGVAKGVAVLSIKPLKKYGTGFYHQHHCPGCYEKYDCADDCTIVDFVDGTPRGSHHVCDSCSAAQVTP